MRVRAIVPVLLVMSGCSYSGCASMSKPKLSPAATVPTPEPNEPQSLMAHLIGYMPGGQACPVSEHVLITARHVVQPPPEEESGLRWFRFSTDYGVEGLAYGRAVLWEADLAIIVTSETLRYYEVAPIPPLVGEKVTSHGYDWRDERRAFASREFKGEVMRTTAGHLMFKSNGEHGTSGSCVLNEKNEVVGIHVGRKPLNNERDVSVAPALWGKWFPKDSVEEARKIGG